MSENPLFPLGLVLYTPGAWRSLNDYKVDTSELLNRHVSGDWSGMQYDEVEENRYAVENGFSVCSCYCLTNTAFDNKPKIWIVTEANRDKTIFLLPEEYLEYSDIF